MKYLQVLGFEHNAMGSLSNSLQDVILFHYYSPAPSLQRAPRAAAMLCACVRVLRTLSPPEPVAASVWKDLLIRMPPCVQEGVCVSLSFQSERGSWSGRTLYMCVILSLSSMFFLMFVCVCVPSEEKKANRSNPNI